MAEAQTGEIFVEGLGIVDIEGDVPTPEESRIIANAANAEPGDEGDPFFVTDEADDEEDVEPPLEGPIGIMPAQARTNVRRNIEAQPGLIQLIAEMGPAAVGASKGAAKGAAVGSAFGPVGTAIGGVAGGIGGGLIGEMAAQELGFAPKSKTNLALTAAGPLAGPVVGKGLQLSKRLLGTLVTKGLSPSRVASARNLVQRATSEFENLGSAILAKQKGIMARSTDDIFRAMRRVKIRMKPDQITNTRESIDTLIKQLEPGSAITEVKQAIRTLQSIKDVTLGNKNGVLLDDFMRARSFIGGVVGRAERALRGSGGRRGLRLGSAKQVFSAMSDDLDRFATSPFRRGAQARLAKAGVSRAKLGMAVDDLEAAIVDATKTAPNVPGGVAINFRSLQDWLRRVTNPNSRRFDKNFTTALADELPALKERIEALAKVTGDIGSPGGPAGLVLRGGLARVARTAIGGALGFLGTGGQMVGGAIGAVAGAQIPEALVAILTTPQGAAFLEAAAKAGRGQINQRAWQTAMQISLRAVSGERDESIPRSRQAQRIDEEDTARIR